MNKLFALVFSCMLFISEMHAQINDSSFREEAVFVETPTGKLHGTLTLPVGFIKGKLALIIAGSGPTDRNGDNPAMRNASLQKLAYALAENNIATVRYDKRGIGESKAAFKKEADLRFEDYIDDAAAWINCLRKQKRFSKIVVIGHSEGSLIGMIAAQKKADKYISIAGLGQPAAVVLKKQLANQPAPIKNASYIIIDSLIAGHDVKNVGPFLLQLFRPSIQPYLRSWFKYDPAAEIKKLKIPVLIVQGTNDIQVDVEDAQKLHAATTGSQLILIENMNHIFRIVEGDRNENAKTYSNADLPISIEMVKAITDFINNK